MKSAREVAHGSTRCEGKGLYLNVERDDLEEREHCFPCDRLTAAIEARDAQWRADEDVVREERDNAEAEVAALRVERDRLRGELERIAAHSCCYPNGGESPHTRRARAALAAPVMPAGPEKEQILGLAVHGADASPQEEKKP